MDFATILKADIFASATEEVDRKQEFEGKMWGLGRKGGRRAAAALRNLSGSIRRFAMRPKLCY